MRIQGQRKRARMAKKKGWLASDWSKCLGYNLCNKQHCCKLDFTELLVPLCLCSPCQNHLLLQPPKTLQITVLCMFIAPLDNNPNCCCLWFGNQIRTWFVYIYTNIIICFKWCYRVEKVSYTKKKPIMSTLSLSEAMWQYVAVFFKAGK